MTSGLHDAAHRLCAVLEAENTALTRTDFAQVGAFQDEKRAALIALNGLATEAADPTVAKDPALGVRLQSLAAENKRLLEQAIMVQTRVMAVLAGAARSAQAPIGYGSKGRPPLRNGAGAVALIMRA